MNNKLNDKHIHDGHRSRMRSKLLCHGPRIFDTYELLEMLLYYTVPYKDTNPISKRLLAEFGGLDGVFSAEIEQLVAVNGVGEKTARLIKDVGVISSVIGAEIVPYTRSIFSDYDDAGGFFVDYFKGVTEKKVVAVYLNNNLDVISIEEIACGIDYESGAIRPKPFIDGAIKHRASVIVSAHNHPYGASYPSPGDRITHHMICNALDEIRVTIAEHYVISGDCFIGIGNDHIRNFCQSPYLDSFIKARRSDEELHGISEQTLNRLNNCYNSDDSEYFSDLLSYCNKHTGSEMALKLLKRFHKIEWILSSSPDELKLCVGENMAVYIKLLASIISRRKTDTFIYDKKYAEHELAVYLKALYLGVSEETVYMLCFDSKGRFTACEFVNSGVVNSTDVLPRKILELALRYSSKKIIIAHNHPGGRAEASGEDMYFTSVLTNLLFHSGIDLIAHCIVAGQECIRLSCKNFEIKPM